MDTLPSITTGRVFSQAYAFAEGHLILQGGILMGKSLTPPKKTAPITSDRVAHLAGVGLKTPSKLTLKQVQELAASVETHIRRKGSKKK
jgi:hypothetical protein